MANIANPRKQFAFSIFAAGLNPFLAQKVTIPERSFDKIMERMGSEASCSRRCGYDNHRPRPADADNK